ncbi:MAG: hypothetical protein Q8L48_37350 [Archangium sp.]|nr:hypothetical protein [Archangium sp.]
MSAGGDAGEAGRASWVAATLALLTTGTFAIAVLTPPLSGPWCTAGCFEYPYADIASRFPRDYWWMFSAMLVSVVFVALMVSVHRCAPAPAKSFSLMGLALGAPGALVLLVDYWVQVAVIQPSVLRSEHDGIALLSQFNPHGVFIALEEIGFLLMSAGLLCLAPVFWRTRGGGRALGWVLIGGFVASLGAVVATSMRFGLQREYFLEVALISVVWLTLIIAGTMLAVLFRRLATSYSFGAMG